MGKPKIRFKGFTEDWEQRKLGDVAEYRRGSFPQPYGNKDWYDGEGAMPFVQVADVTDEMNLVADTKQKISKLAQPMSVYADKNSVLVTLQGSIGRVAITQYGAFVDRTVLIFEKYKKEIDYIFWAYIIKQKFIEEARKAPGGTIKTITKEALSDFDLMLPDYKEQMRIGQYFQSLDHLITLHQRKYDETKKLKKYMLQKMFPQNGMKVPEIRFEGFTGDWEQRKFEELYQRNVERNAELISYDKTISIATMSFKDEGNGASDDSLSIYKVLRIGDIAFEGHTNKQFRFGRFVVNDIGTGIMSPRFSTLRPVKEMSVDFWKQYIHHEPIMRKVLVNSTKAGTMMNELVIPEFLNQTIPVPKDEEQKKIGTYFSNLDHLITLHQRKCDELVKIKKYMLQNMFV